MDDRMVKMLNERYPFMTVCIYAGEEYIGIVQNRDDVVTTIYDFAVIEDIKHKQLFLELANTWWWESNRSVPINIFLRDEWEVFRRCLKTFSNRDLQILHGPACSLTEIARRKSKRKSITLVRRV